LERLGEREAALPDNVGARLGPALAGSTGAVQNLAEVIRAYAREQAVDVPAFRRESDSYYGAIRELIEGSDLRKSENSDSARRLMESVQDTRRRLTGVVDGLRRRRDQLLEMASAVPGVSEATADARAAYDDTLAAVAISDAAAESLTEVIRQRLGRLGR
jgi:hypothetical protein